MVPRFNAEGLVCPDRHYCILPLARLDDMDGVLEFDPRRNHLDISVGRQEIGSR